MHQVAADDSKTQTEPNEDQFEFGGIIRLLFALLGNWLKRCHCGMDSVLCRCSSVATRTARMFRVCR
jgi:hypothetical protein